MTTTTPPAARRDGIYVIDARAIKHRCTCGALPDGPFAKHHPPVLWQFATHTRACLTNTTPRDFR
jgi:hypothetical protein